MGRTVVKDMRVVCDLECDSLNPTRIWCIGAKDIDTGKVYTWTTEEELQNGFPDFTACVSEWIGHNFLTFDARAIQQILGVNIPVGSITDTLILSRLLYTGLVHRQSLEAWGKTLGVEKGEFKDFSKYTPEMLKYMLQDLEVTEALYKKFLPELEKFSSYSVRLEHKTQDILNQQKRNGFYLNINKAYDLHKELDAKIGALEEDILADFPPVMKLHEVYYPRLTQSGELSITAQRKLARYPDKRRLLPVEIPAYELYEEQAFNLGSPKQIVERMSEIGWQPVEFTDKGTPRVSEANFETLPKNAPQGARKIGEWLMLRNRRTVLEGWFDAYNPETRRLHGTVTGIGAITHRMSHKDPQMANVPATRSPYGEELRSCLGVEDTENYTLLGVDLSGIQLRILAHYLEDKAYTDAVCFGKKDDGTDIHSFNMNILREVVSSCTRDNAKTFVYAMLLGASGTKLGSILGVSAQKGNACKGRIFEKIPGFKRVKKMCEVAAKRGYMFGIDGRRTPIKSAHFALSAYLQCGEAVIMKQAVIFAHDGRFAHLDWKQLAVVHDEVQIEVLREHAEELARGILACIEESGRLFELRCPLAGEWKVGDNWSVTH